MPEKAKKPKNSDSCFAGTKRAISERLADWFGPMKIPTRIAETQNQPRVGASAPSSVATASAATLRPMVALPPIRSSTKPNANAPSPAPTLRTMPNVTNSWKLKPNVPTA